MATNKLVGCPYDEAHKVKESRLQLHITKCRMNHLSDKDKFICPFNATHVLPSPEKSYHMQNCPDRAPLDRKLSQSLYANNANKGRTAVPSYHETPLMVTEESWDDDSNYVVSGFVCPEPPPGAIIEPPPLSKPAERRRLYQELHQRPTERDVKAVQPPQPKQNVPNEPKQPTEASKVEMIRRQNVQNFDNLGLGRGRGAPPPSRIAANIFPSTASAQTERSYSAAITTGMNQLGLGRGQIDKPVGGASASIFDDDDEFPALGFGRGVTKGPRNGIRTPGGRQQI